MSSSSVLQITSHQTESPLQLVEEDLFIYKVIAYYTKNHNLWFRRDVLRFLAVISRVLWVTWNNTSNMKRDIAKEKHLCKLINSGRNDEWNLSICLYKKAIDLYVELCRINVNKYTRQDINLLWNSDGSLFVRVAVGKEEGARLKLSGVIL